MYIEHKRILKVGAHTISRIKSYLMPSNPHFQLASKLLGETRQHIIIDRTVGWS
jgi:hypothetical protein